MIFSILYTAVKVSSNETNAQASLVSWRCTRSGKMIMPILSVYITNVLFYSYVIYITRNTQYNILRSKVLSVLLAVQPEELVFSTLVLGNVQANSLAVYHCLSFIEADFIFGILIGFFSSSKCFFSIFFLNIFCVYCFVS